MTIIVLFVHCSKFESITFSDSPDKNPDVSVPVNESEEFCCVFSCEFGDNLMLYGAEMDGIEIKEPGTEPLTEPVSWKNVNFIELKTNKIIETVRQDTFFRKKLLRWWCQSFLVGIENIWCGYRTNDGIVIDLKKYRVADMIKMAKVNTQTEKKCFKNRRKITKFSTYFRIIGNLRPV